MHRHRDLIGGAVDVWELTAGLEARGVTDADARRLRHRDVFGLAEEVYARVPPTVTAARTTAAHPHPESPWLTPATAAVSLLPGLLCVLGAVLHLAVPGAVLGAVTCLLILRRTARLPGTVAVALLLAYALRAPEGGAATFAALALSLAPALCCTHWFAVRARAQLAPSHGLAEFADAVRPRLAAVLAAYGLALFLLLTAAAAIGGPAPVAGPAALGLLLFTARLLARHGHPGPAAAGLGAACAAEALTLAAVPLHPHLAGATAEAVICGAAALALAVQAFRVLPRASAHRGPVRP
ncbi:hypothetical protein OG552_24020 [Streptomyces sp. NBC_01476]|uniref:hypothetical protein n=1 Tax=Streptomyces sp. NBC_01476 TaxID=2903881 RepID=UPI002E33D0E4|nr:hypothetical protein [Streptomyces sp. NBC_01476]